MIEAGKVYFRKASIGSGKKMFQIVNVLAGPDKFDNYKVEYYMSSFDRIEYDTTSLFSGVSDDGPGDKIMPIEKASAQDLHRFIKRIFEAISIKKG